MPNAARGEPMPGNNGDRSRTPEGVFGKALKFFRERAGLTQAELGALLNYSNDVISKIETGDRPPTEGLPERVDALAQLNTNGELARLWGWLKDSVRHSAYPGWFSPWPDEEARARLLRWFEPMVVPGILQTEGYARALLAGRIGSKPDDVDADVSARLERQAILDREDPPELWVVIDEAVLRRPVGGKHVIREQLNHLAEMAQRPNVVLQVIPAGVAVHDGLRGGGFTVADRGDGSQAAYQDASLRGEIIDNHPDAAALAIIWDRIKAEALSRTASLELIEEVAKSWT
jgi:transcriptional regulator with XRE-family HTH domain